MAAIAYPREFETDVVLRDGSTVHVRPVRPDDQPRLARFFRELSIDSLGLRFFSAGVSEQAAARMAGKVDYDGTFGLIATLGSDRRIVGHAMYGEMDPTTVEVAFVLSDAMQGRGLGTVLLAHVAEAAQSRGYATMVAEVLPGNARMLDVMRQSGFPFELSSAPGCVRAVSPVSLSPEAISSFEARDHTGAVAAVRHLLAPASVALIGASRDRSHVGGAILHNLIDAGFAGTVYPVNAHATSVQGIKAYPSVAALPEPPNLAVVAVPAQAVPAVMSECAELGVPAAVVISAGFSEAGAAGKRLQDEVMQICRRSGMRLLGPNCLGVVSTSPAIRLNATFARQMPPAGPLAMASQSGALGLAAIEQAAGRGLGLAGFASVGNKADVSGNDLLDYWEEDPSVEVIALYLESFGNPRKFARVARRVGRTKPIVAVKSGRSRAGARAAASHTGAMLSASDLTVDALFGQSGVIRADSLGDLLDVTALLGTQPVPRGSRVAVMTNSGGPGILCTDALEAEGLELATLSQDLQRKLRRSLGAAASTGNPVDMLATAGPRQYQRVMKLLAEDDAVDAVIAIYTPTGLDDPAAVLDGMAAGIDAVDGRLPVLIVALMPEPPRGLLNGRRGSAPIYAFPEDAARALGHAVRHGLWLERPEGKIPDFVDARPGEAAAVIADGLASGLEWLAPDEVERLLRCYGVPLVDSRTVRTSTEAGVAAAELGDAVALKAAAPGLVHKTETGAVRVGLSGEEAVTAAAREMEARLASSGYEVETFLVQRMAPSGVEMLVGVAHDPLFGPVVVCGAGGTTAELFGDVSARITPLTDRDAREMVAALRVLPLLRGWRGAAPSDIAALEDVLLRIGALVENHPEIAELDLNPVVVGSTGVLVVDARVRLHAAPRPQAWPSLGSAPPC
jgi:acetyl coenzyme A synthetase (ADP forming)-like protein